MRERKYLGLSLSGRTVSSLSDEYVVDGFGLTDYELKKFREWCPAADKMLAEFRKSHDNPDYTSVYYTLMLDRRWAGEGKHHFTFWIKEELEVRQTRRLAVRYPETKSFYCTEEGSDFEFEERPESTYMYRYA